MKRLAAVAAMFFATVAAAHETLPASFVVVQTSTDRFDVQLRLPAREGPAPSIQPRFPEGCTRVGELRELPERGAVVMRLTMQCPGLQQGEIWFAGLGASKIDLLARATFLDGSTVTKVMRPDFEHWKLTELTTARQYLLLGIEHILTGVDHLLFVLGLLLLVNGVKALVKTVTAFTVAHSITLGLATLGVVEVPVAPVEATIALSIVFLARELLVADPSQPTLARRKPWLVAFSFGLLHGFGFAGAMSDAGVARADLPLALLLFNVGVELGQLAFVLVVSLIPVPARVRAPAARAVSWVIGIVAAFWFLQRAAAIFA